MHNVQLMKNFSLKEIKKKSHSLLGKISGTQASIIRETQRKLERVQLSLSEKDYTDITLTTPIKKYAFVFVCQEGKIEYGSLLLAASLKRFLQCEYELIAAIPSPTNIMGTPNKATVHALEEMGVRIVDIHNTMVSQNQMSKRYLITNKMYCLTIPTSADKLIFLDSNIIWKKPFSGDSRLYLPLNIRKAAHSENQALNGKWQKMFDTIGITMPSIRIRTEYPEGMCYSPPSFNSAFIAIKPEFAVDLSHHWFQCWKALNNSGLLKQHSYHIGQFALTLAVHKMQVPYEMIEREWIYDYYFKYRKPEHIQMDQEMNVLANSLVEEYPEIAKALKNEWQCFLNNKISTST